MMFVVQFNMNSMASVTAVELMCARVAALLLTRPSIISYVRFIASSHERSRRARSTMTHAVTDRNARPHVIVVGYMSPPDGGFLNVVSQPRLLSTFAT